MEEKKGRGVKRLLTVCALSIPFAAQAQPLYDCPHLKDKSRQTLSEMTQGDNGWFFRKESLREPDLLDEATKGYLTRTQRAFKELSTELVILIIPPRGIVAGKHLSKSDQEYYVDFLREEFQYLLQTIAKTGTVVVDVQEEALAANKDGESFFFPRDIHWTPLGASLAARKTAEVLKSLPGYTKGDRRYVTSVTGKDLPYRSLMADEIQYLCSGNTSPQHYTQYTTSLDGEKSAEALFGASSQPPLVLLGTSFSHETTYNFDGFLSEYTGMDVANYALSAGGLFQSITNYLSMPRTQRGEPKYIIWEMMPYYHYNDSFGWRQIIPSIKGECAKEVAIASKTYTLDGKPLLLEVPAIEKVAGHDYFLFISGPTDMDTIPYEMEYADGDGEIGTIKRHKDSQSTGRAFLELDDELSAPFLSVRLDIPPALRGEVEIRLCKTK